MPRNVIRVIKQRTTGHGCAPEGSLARYNEGTGNRDVAIGAASDFALSAVQGELALTKN